MSQIEFLNQKYVEEHITAFQATKFYVEDDTVREVYYNPDSNAGGQLVTNYYSRTDIAETYEKHTDPNNFWEHLESIAKQYLIDIDTPEFESEAKEFVEAPCDFSGNKEETMNALYNWAGGMEQNQSEQGMKMGGI